MTNAESHRNIIVNTTHKYVEVEACPGSGKTTNLLARWEYMCKIKKIPENKILILSFSKSTVKVIKDRIQQLITNTKQSPAESNLSNVTVQTVHSFAYQLISGSVSYVEVLHDKEMLLASVINSIIEDVKQGQLWADKPSNITKSRLEKLEALLSPINLKLVSTLLEEKRASKQSLFTTLERSKFSKISSYRNVIIEVQRRFLEAKKTIGLMDFTDMLVEAIKIIDKNPASVPFTHILVDEYQDCSAAQTKLLAKLASLPKRNIMVFGDQNQSIFGFSGASYTPLSSVLDGVKTLSLPFSHRLSKQTAELASALAQLTKQRAIKTNHSDQMPVLVHDKSLNAQIKHVVDDIKLLIDDGVNPNDIVILARTKAQLKDIEASLLTEDMSTDRAGLTRNIKHIINVLKLVRIVERCTASNKPVQPALLRKALKKLKSVDEIKWKKAASTLHKALTIHSLEGRYRICAESYLQLLGGVRKNLELRAEVNRFEPISRMHKNATKMYNALKNMDTRSVVTSTIHAAKGQEWDYVFIIGVTEGLLPIYHSKNEQSLAEERNLLYVAITRARKTVRLYHAPTPHAKSRRQFESVCRFLQEPAAQKTLQVE